MRKITFFLMFTLFAFVLKANDGVMLTLKAEPGKSLDFDVYVTNELQNISVDWGDGNKQVYENVASIQANSDLPTKISGTVSGEGTVTFYGDPLQLYSFESVAAFDGSKISVVDLSAVINLEQLTMQSHALTQIDLNKLTKLTSLTLSGNALSAIDLSQCSEIKALVVSDNKLSKIDLSNLSKLSSLTISNNTQLSEVVWPTEAASFKKIYALKLSLSGALNLTQYPALNFVNFNNNKLTSLDLSGLEMDRVFCMNNQLSELKVDNVISLLNCSGNRLTPATLPAVSPKTYTYAPQTAVLPAAQILEGESIDLSTLGGEGDELTYTWKYADGTAIDAADCVDKGNGVFSFPNVLDKAVYCEVSSKLFPKFTGSNVLKTTEVRVGFTGTILTLSAEAGKALDFDVYLVDTLQNIGVDWGDGKKVVYENVASNPDIDWPTSISGTVAGEGTVTLYGDPAQLSEFEALGALEGSKVSSIDVSKAENLTTLTVSSHALTSIDLSHNLSISSLALNNNQLAEVDLSKHTHLYSVDLSKNSLTKLDVSQSPSLWKLVVSDNQITELSLPTEAPGFTTFTALNNRFEGSLDLSVYPKLSAVNVSGSKLVSIDASGLNLATLFCQNNQLTELKVDSVKTTLNCMGNKLTPATLPQLNVKNYTYAPQAVYMLADSVVKVGDEVDLSTLVAANDEVTYVWRYDETTVADASLYTVENGVTVFNAVPLDKVYCEIVSTLFPNFTGANAFVTTAVKVEKGASSIDETSAEASARIYAVAGRVVAENLLPDTLVSVYSLSSVKCGEKESVDGKAEFELPQGVYLVVAGKEAYKVVVP